MEERTTVPFRTILATARQYIRDYDATIGTSSVNTYDLWKLGRYRATAERPQRRVEFARSIDAIARVNA